ncbi:MAG: hypothetical protein HWE22_02710 [Flavobacteriales bacterium]|nr:hypothetical protein [Flavobacteriales bacterium]
MKSLIVACTILFSFVSFGQTMTDIEELSKNSVINKVGGNSFNISLWLTDYLWEYSAKSAPQIDQAFLEDMLRIVKGYNIFGVVIGKRDANEIIRFADEEAIRNTLVLLGQDSVEYQPIPQEEISEELDYLLRVMKPMFARMMGQFGENMHLVVFQKRNNAGELIADPTVERNITLHTSGCDFEWRLPMSALVPKKKCPEDGELMNGTWKFCPYHGSKLEAIEQE